MYEGYQRNLSDHSRPSQDQGQSSDLSTCRPKQGSALPSGEEWRCLFSGSAKPNSAGARDPKLIPAAVEGGPARAQEVLLPTCERISLSPPPSLPIARGRAAPKLLAHVPCSKAARTAEQGLCPRGYRARCIHVGRLIGACAATLPLIEAIRPDKNG
jgi:hypothetical protein